MIFHSTPEHLIEARNTLIQFSIVWSVWGGMGLAYRTSKGANFKSNFFYGYLVCLASLFSWVWLIHAIPSGTLPKGAEGLVVIGSFPFMASFYAYLLGKTKRQWFQLKTKFASFSVGFFLLFWLVAIPISGAMFLGFVLSGLALNGKARKGISSRRVWRKTHIRQDSDFYDEFYDHRYENYYYPSIMEEQYYQGFYHHDD